jgi:N-acetylmuramoyl-L-alanine amidase
MPTERKRLCLALAVIFALNILIIGFAQKAGAVTYRRGSTGSAVSQIQTKLRDWGYYSGAVDGLYGSRRKRRSGNSSKERADCGRSAAPPP